MVDFRVASIVPTDIRLPSTLVLFKSSRRRKTYAEQGNIVIFTEAQERQNFGLSLLITLHSERMGTRVHGTGATIVSNLMLGYE
uniref:Uncharacterized protein n=1 Tax=Oryza barthii TaxID=65489 RepID=A0A679BC75_9ORYZ|nr:hypothetical protein [Oryza barthii]